VGRPVNVRLKAFLQIIMALLYRCHEIHKHLLNITSFFARKFLCGCLNDLFCLWGLDCPMLWRSNTTGWSLGVKLTSWRSWQVSAVRFRSDRLPIVGLLLVYFRYGAWRWKVRRLALRPSWPMEVHAPSVLTLSLGMWLGVLLFDPWWFWRTSVFLGVVLSMCSDVAGSYSVSSLVATLSYYRPSPPPPLLLRCWAHFITNSTYRVGRTCRFFFLVLNLSQGYLICREVRFVGSVEPSFSFLRALNGPHLW
jgi:hypothetical protein